MNQGYGKSEHVEQLIQHAIEVFDLVEIVPAAKVARSLNRQYLNPDVALESARYGKVGIERERALALNNRVC